MKISHIAFRFYPDRGGSETYVYNLIKVLLKRGIKNLVICGGKTENSYFYKGIKVENIGNPYSANKKNKSLEFSKNIFEKIYRYKADIVHFHWIPENILELIKCSQSPPAVLTIHHFGALCPRGDMMRFGSEICSGYLSKKHCLPCLAHKKGLKKPFSFLLKIFSNQKIKEFFKKLPESKIKTALLLDKYLEKRIQNTLDFLKYVKKIIVLSKKSRSILQENGIEKEKIKILQIGLHHKSPKTLKNKKITTEIKGIYVGRITEQKGLNIICEAINEEKLKNIKIDIFGPTSKLDNQDILLLKRIKRIPKVNILGPLPDHEVVNVMATYDFAIVPSQIMETGPFTVIEAFQAKIPVIGSNISGINELVLHNKNGYLVQLGSKKSWKKAFRLISEEPKRLQHWKKHIKWEWTMTDVGRDTAKIYQAIINGRNSTK